MKIRKPSFRIKSSREVCFSSDSRFLYSIGSRLSAFSIVDRKETFSKKHIKNESYLTIGNSSHQVCIKNTNGELVVCKTNNGELVSQTGKIKHYNEGEEIYFSQCGDFLIDMSWSGAIQIYEVKSLKLEFNINPPADYMIASSSYNPKDNSYAIFYQAKEKEKSPSFITVLSEKDILSNNIVWSRQKSKALKFVFGFEKWSDHILMSLEKKSSLSLMSVNLQGDKLAVVYILDVKKPDAKHSLAIIDLSSGKIEKQVELFPYMTQIHGLSWSPNSNYIFVCTELLPEDKKLSFYQRYEKYHPHDSCKINIVETEAMNLLQSVSFPEAKNIVFSPDEQFMAIASTVKGLVLHRNHVNEYFGLMICE